MGSASDPAAISLEREIYTPDAAAFLNIFDKSVPIGVPRKGTP